jgi:hypothetical protein
MTPRMMMTMMRYISLASALSSADPIPHSAPLLLFYSSRSFNDDTPGPFYFLRISVFWFLYFRTMYFPPFYRSFTLSILSPSRGFLSVPPVHTINQGVTMSICMFVVALCTRALVGIGPYRAVVQLFARSIILHYQVPYRAVVQLQYMSIRSFNYSALCSKNFVASWR